MIINALLTFLYILLYAITYPLRIIPDVPELAEINASVLTASGYISNLNGIFPVDTIITQLGIFISYELIIALYKIIKWLYQKIPGIK